MGTITVNVNDDTENIFRETVKKELGEGKGKLGKAFEDAMRKWTEERRQTKANERLIAKMEKGFDLGKELYKKREELHDRKIFPD